MAASSSSSSSPSLSTLRDAVDSLLQEYLAALDAYQSARATLHDHLKHVRRPPPLLPLSLPALLALDLSNPRPHTQGYLDLARAKLALGPGRVSPRSYDLSDSAAQLGVCALSLSLPPSLSHSPLAMRAQGRRH